MAVRLSVSDGLPALLTLTGARTSGVQGTSPCLTLVHAGPGRCKDSETTMPQLIERVLSDMPRLGYNAHTGLFQGYSSV